MSTVTLSTELPLPATTACALAQKPALFTFVVSPIIRMPRLDLPERIEPGAGVSGRIWWFGVVPAWTHRLTIVRLGDTEIYTHEQGGPVRTWNHRLTFTPITEHRCRYTDEIETGDGVVGLVTRVFIRVLFPYRHRRWRALAQVMA